MSLLEDREDLSVMVRINIASVGHLQTMSSRFLGTSYKFAQTLTERLHLGKRFEIEVIAKHKISTQMLTIFQCLSFAMNVKVDATDYATKFEAAMLLLENLTPHQEEKYSQVEAALKLGQRVDIRAPAGAGATFHLSVIFRCHDSLILILSGKTYIALKVLLEEVLNGTRGMSLFVTRSEALCVHVAKWLFVRLRQRLDDENEAKRKIEEYFRVAFPSFVFNQYSRRCCVDVDLHKQSIRIIDGLIGVLLFFCFRFFALSHC